MVSVAFGTGERISILIIALLTIFYTFEGGMRAVIWTDVIQFALYLTGFRSWRSFCSCTKFPADGPA